MTIRRKTIKFKMYEGKVWNEKELKDLNLKELEELKYIIDYLLKEKTK